MATPTQLTTLAKLSVEKVKASNIGLKEVDLIEFAAILTHAKHLDGNTEDQAKVSTKRWSEVSPAWKSRYRNLVRQFLKTIEK
jgi:hypothetical protein